jgi:hypothetical protein
MNLAVLAIGRQKIHYAAKVRNGFVPRTRSAVAAKLKS